MLKFGIGRNVFGRRHPLGMCFFADDDGDGGGGGGAGDGLDAGGNGTFNVDINLDNSGGDGEGAGDSLVGFEIPETYKEKEWAKGIKTQEDLWKMTDNAQVLVGKKTLGVPTETSTPEEVAAFNKAFGVPDTSDIYEFGESENFKEVFGEASRDEEVVKDVKEVFHKAGLSTKQAAEVQKGYDGILSKIVEKKKAEAAELNANFDTLVDKEFGDKKDAILDTAKGLINAHAPEGFADYIKALPNESLIVMAGVLKNIQEKYIDEDELPSGGSRTGQSADNIRKQIQKVVASTEFQNPMNAGHDAAKREWMNLSSQLDSIRNKK